MKKLSPTQQHVVDKMKEGWGLRGHWRLKGSTVWLQRHGEIEDVRFPTFFALQRKGLLIETRIGDTSSYKLPEEV